MIMQKRCIMAAEVTHSSKKFCSPSKQQYIETILAQYFIHVDRKQSTDYFECLHTVN